ncbi:Class 2 transcription repressor NC2, beta subunit (Dr1) [Pseudoloma neurophilia]|uniref:Class 2 transcription repressor NC2, beta subunit (Dr1) n=1 Tax=Pseudoloma neurophilia TaxID=146866 RepID=A0A0R0LVR4_9MICR|nr:Class 2 transcription repressor NC2, beta subunit (Dr1) [Pseudoloma neurophilia]
MPLKPEEDLTLPRSTIDKILIYHKLAVPRTIRHHLTKLGDQFILEASLQANFLCEKEKKKTISHEHILKALENMDFNFEKELLEVLEENKNISKKKPSRVNKLETSEFTLEELKAQQAKLFKNARIEYENMEQIDPNQNIKIVNTEELEKAENEPIEFDDDSDRSPVEQITENAADSDQIGLAVDIDEMEDEDSEVKT